MGKVLRLHQGNENLIDWQHSEKYGANVINQIIDPDGENAKKEITSIPSPFARIDLVKTAFKYVTERKQLFGNTIYHKLVSDCLDVGEIFFNADRLRDKIEILVWDKELDLKKLLNSPQKAHRTVGRTLQMYLQQEQQDVYNFGKLRRVYLLNYIGKDRPSAMNIIGATSPATLFFSSANTMDYVAENIHFGQHRVFSDNFQPLAQRDIEFQKYLYLFRLATPNFAQLFPEVNEYLELTYGELNYDLQKNIDGLVAETIHNYPQLSVGKGADYVEILGKSLHSKPLRTHFESDFEINSELCEHPKPLVLPIENGNSYADLRYTQATWGKSNSAPFYDPKPLHERVLPSVGDKYPYLTIGDFLEDRIVRMPYKISNNSFFDGNNSSEEEVSFLLPLKKDFFKYFSPIQLMTTLANGKKMIEIVPQPNGVLVTLRIPIGKQKHITYQRAYLTNSDPDSTTNFGTVVDKKVGLGLFAPIRFGGADAAHYRIALFDKSHNATHLHLYRQDQSVSIQAHVVRRPKTGTGIDRICSIEAYVVNHPFDTIQLTDGLVSGFIIPKFREHKGVGQYTFAVDFGTTNTHIAYNVDSNSPKVFEIAHHQKQMHRLHLDYKQDRDIQRAFEDDFVPDTIGEMADYRFPIRSVFSEQQEIDFHKPTYTIANGNIPFRYEKARTPAHNRVHTDMKWSAVEKDRVKLYLENIFLLIRNKVLIEGGRLDDTRIIWFYPASMTEGHYNRFKTFWRNLYAQYIGRKSENLIAISESVAPYYYFSHTKGAMSNVINVDIGGGTTDIFVVENNQPKILSSIRFAANTIFGDGYNRTAENNGFVNRYYKEFEEILATNGLIELVATLKNLKSENLSSDLSIFFFSLSDNQQVLDKNITSLNYLEKLAENEQMKYTFILFYASIIYYTAHQMKSKGLQLPLTIAFSGNGAKTLKILSEDNATIAHFVQLIFEKVYGQKYPPSARLQLIFEPNPKEATCKGGILHPVAEKFEITEQLKSSLIGNDTSTFINKKNRVKYSEVTTNFLSEITQQVENFVTFLFELNDENNNLFVKKLNADVNIISDVRAICIQHLIEYLKNGVEQAKNESQNWGNNNTIEETLFFYPIVGLLNNLALEIDKMTK